MTEDLEEWPGPAGTVRTAVLLIALGVVVFLTYLMLRPFLLPFATAAPVAILLAPTLNRLAAGLGQRRGLAAALLLLWIALLVAIPLSAGLTLLGSQAGTFFDWLGPQLDPSKVQTFLNKTLPEKAPWLASAWEALDAYIAPTAASLLTQLSGGVRLVIQRLAAGVGSTVVGLFLFFLFLFFLLRDGRAVIALLRSFSPLSPEQEARVITHLVATVRGTLLGVLIVPLVQGSLAALGYWMFGVPHAILWGGITVLASLIPLLGAPAVWIPISIYVYLTGEAWKAAVLFVYGTAVVSGIDNIIKPMLLAGAAKVHPLLGFLAVVGGTLAFGPAGLLVGPIILSLAISGLHIYRSEFLARGELASGELAPGMPGGVSPAGPSPRPETPPGPAAPDVI